MAIGHLERPPRRSCFAVGELAARIRRPIYTDTSQSVHPAVCINFSVKPAIVQVPKQVNVSRRKFLQIRILLGQNSVAASIWRPLPAHSQAFPPIRLDPFRKYADLQV
jgi:hypothetical protein